MSQTETVNRQFVLAERPQGEPTKHTLRLREEDIPSAPAGQMLLRTEYLSLDPYMRGAGYFGDARFHRLGGPEANWGA